MRFSAKMVKDRCTGPDVLPIVQTRFTAANRCHEKVVCVSRCIHLNTKRVYIFLKKNAEYAQNIKNPPTYKVLV